MSPAAETRLVPPAATPARAHLHAIASLLIVHLSALSNGKSRAAAVHAAPAFRSSRASTSRWRKRACFPRRISPGASDWCPYSGESPKRHLEVVRQILQGKELVFMHDSHMHGIRRAGSRSTISNCLELLVRVSATPIRRT